jgi:hypothetical protein
VQVAVLRATKWVGLHTNQLEYRFLERHSLLKRAVLVAARRLTFQLLFCNLEALARLLSVELKEDGKGKEEAAAEEEVVFGAMVAEAGGRKRDEESRLLKALFLSFLPLISG